MKEIIRVSPTTIENILLDERDSFRLKYHRSLIDQLKAAKEIEALTAEVLMLRDQIETCSKKDLHEENIDLRERNWFLEARDYEPPKTLQEPCPRCSQPWIRHDCPVKSGGAELSASV